MFSGAVERREQWSSSMRSGTNQIADRLGNAPEVNVAGTRSAKSKIHRLLSDNLAKSDGDHS